MKDQELFKQLHMLSKMKPDADWKASQRNIMLKQINVNEEAKPKTLFWELGRLSLSFVDSFSQPVGIFAVVAFVFLTGGFVSLKAAQDTKPGDSLYAAKIMGEKTQFALTFTEKGKAQLGLEFAVKRAEEIKQVMNDNNPAKDEKVEKLVNDFKKELDGAKSRIAKISEEKTVSISNDPKDKPVFTPTTSIENEEVIKEGETAKEDVLFSAGSDKDDNGISVSGEKNKNESPVAKKPEIASTTKPVVPVATKTPEKILEEASALLKADAYEEAVNVLEEAGPAIDQSFNQGEVKGEESVGEVGTSSEVK